MVRLSLKYAIFLEYHIPYSGDPGRLDDLLQIQPVLFTVNIHVRFGQIRMPSAVKKKNMMIFGIRWRYKDGEQRLAKSNTRGSNVFTQLSVSSANLTDCILSEFPTPLKGTRYSFSFPLRRCLVLYSHFFATTLRLHRAFMNECFALNAGFIGQETRESHRVTSTIVNLTAAM